MAINRREKKIRKKSGYILLGIINEVKWCDLECFYGNQLKNFGGRKMAKVRWNLLSFHHQPLKCSIAKAIVVVFLFTLAAEFYVVFV